MNWPTELRIFADQEKYKFGIINKSFVVNIKNLTKNKEVRFMLEKEKTFRLEQLNALKSEYEDKLEMIKAQDINSLISERLATAKEAIEKEVVLEQQEELNTVSFQLKAIDEMIAKAEAIEVEVEEVEVEVEPVIEEEPIAEIQNDIPTESETEFI